MARPVSPCIVITEKSDISSYADRLRLINKYTGTRYYNLIAMSKMIKAYKSRPFQLQETDTAWEIFHQALKNEIHACNRLLDQYKLSKDEKRSNRLGSQRAISARQKLQQQSDNANIKCLKCKDTGKILWRSHGADYRFCKCELGKKTLLAVNFPLVGRMRSEELT